MSGMPTRSIYHICARMLRAYLEDLRTILVPRAYDPFGPWLGSRALAWDWFSKAPETFWARKAIFSSSVFKDEEVNTPETSCMKITSFHIKNL